MYFWLVQPGPDAIGIVAISHGCPGVAARACSLVGLEPSKVPCGYLVSLKQMPQSHSRSEENVYSGSVSCTLHTNSSL